MKTAVTLTLVGILFALPCAAIAETWTDDVRSAYDATGRTAPGMEIAMLTPEEAEHIRGIVAEEVSAVRVASDGKSALASADVLAARDMVEAGHGKSFWRSPGGVAVAVLGLIVLGGTIYMLIDQNQGDSTVINNTGDGNVNSGAGDQETSTEAPAEEE